MGQYSQVIFIVAIVAVFYFLIIRPQKKRQSDQAELASNLRPGAEIVTIGGLYGTIVSIDGDRVRIEVADGSELVFVKNAIARIVPPTVDEEDEGSNEDIERTSDDADAPADEGGDETDEDAAASSAAEAVGTVSEDARADV
jgi:preprotein translocase subunit YajC